MEWVIEYIEAQNYLKVTGSGLFSINQHFQVFDDIIKQEYWKPGMPLLFDNRRMDFTGIDFKVVSQASSNYERMSDRIGCTKGAMLMKSISDFGIGRQFEIISNNKGPGEIRVFLDEKEALLWLLDSYAQMHLQR
jgi:hypothetical protein